MQPGADFVEGGVVHDERVLADVLVMEPDSVSDFLLALASDARDLRL